MNVLRTILELDLPAWAMVALKGTLAMLLAFAAGTLARNARASLRHALYAALFVLLLLLPFAPRFVPAVPIPVPVTAPVATEIEAPVTAVAAQVPVAQPIWSPSLQDVYLAGVFLMLLSLTAGVVRLRQWAASGEVWLDGTRLATDVACASGIRRAVLVVLADRVAVPMTFGFRRQTIILPSDARSWDEESLRRALRHELEHVRRDDWALQLMAHVACAVWWPHPLVWVAWRRFCTEAERTCDDAVVRAFEPATYAQQLVGLARSIRRRARVPALAMASPTRLSERIDAILDPAQRRGPHGRVASTAMVCVLGLALAAFGSFRLVGAESGGGRQKAAERGVESARGDFFHEDVIHAAESGDITALSFFLEQGFNVNRTFAGDGSALLIAAKFGQLDTVRFLLERGADPNLPSPGDGNPLIAAANKGQLEVMELLLDSGARIDEVVPGDENALITAAGAGRANAVRLLIAHGANVNLGVLVHDDNNLPLWRTPLSEARRAGETEIEQMLLAAGARK